MEAEVLASERELTGADTRVSGPVRLTAGDGLATYVLAPRLHTLQQAHPELRVELRAGNLALDLSRREADVAVRLFRPREQSLVARRLAPFVFNVYGTEPYFARRGRPSGWSGSSPPALSARRSRAASSPRTPRTPEAPRHPPRCSR
ncbi:MAG TPA: LysR substrate-binding domain-containing protein [Myxococcus sp.]|nr:LysR substrate-binding domain-containing protein [Myxococcus sp.]